MAGVTPDAGQAVIARHIYKNSHSLTLRLYSNDVTPGAATVLGDFTEVSGNNYAAKSLADGDATVDSGGETTFPDQDFTASGGSWTVYGWYLTMLDTDGATETLLHAERDPNAPVTVSDGSTYRVSLSGTVS